MKVGISEEIKSTIREWAENQELILKIIAFGSRVESRYREDSDLDLAFEIDAREGEDKFTTWICEKQGWFDSLQQLIPITIQIELLDEEVGTPNISNGVSKNSDVIYTRKR